jgi:hypothetical protein
MPIVVASDTRSRAAGAGDRAVILEIAKVPGASSGAANGGNDTEYARIRGTSGGRHEAWVRRAYLSPEEDAHSERSTLFSPSLSGSGAGEGRERGALDTSSSSFTQSDWEDTVEASSGDNAEVHHTQVPKRSRWIPSRISEARRCEAATAETAATSTEVHVDIDDADNEAAEGASVDD